MSAPSGSTVYQVVSGASNATQATAETAFATAFAAITPRAGTSINVLGYCYTVTSDSQAATYLYTVSALIQYIAP